MAGKHVCNCGEAFPGTLHGAWNAKLHAEDRGHRLRHGASLLVR